MGAGVLAITATDQDSQYLSLNTGKIGIREISERERDIDRCLVLEQFSPGELPQPEQPLEAEDSQLCRLDFSDLEPSDSWPLSPLDRELEGRQ